MSPAIPNQGMIAQPVIADAMPGLPIGGANTAHDVVYVISRSQSASNLFVSPADSGVMRTMLLGQDASRRERVARSFAERVSEISGVKEIRLTAVDGELVVTVFTEDRDMERDLTMHSVFASATADLEDAATLSILTYRADRADGAGSLLA